MARRAYALTVALAVVMGVVSVATAWALDLPLRDPDGMFGPSYVRLPVLVLLFFAADVVPRALYRARGVRGSLAHARQIAAQRWNRGRVTLAVVGLASFYLTYVGYRNLKSFLPWIREDLYDEALLWSDRVLFLGEHPATLLHGILGTGISAHVLSLVYVGYLLFVPASLAAWLVWSRSLAAGFWYCTALSLNWVLGVVSYYLVPTQGPVFAEPSLFWELPATAVAQLQAALSSSRFDVFVDPHGTEAVQSIAGFASLHVSVVFSAALITHLTVRTAWVRRAMWTYLALTIVSTVYFGWHYVADDLAGLLIGAVSVWLSAVATGHHLHRDYRGQVFGPGEAELAPEETPAERATITV
ncbi:MAG: phosphatase PAP2 family protein [Actinomycetota bacterium]|nr:phosphatase PAP2 family protein [Actinomycetota bacterium]